LQGLRIVEIAGSVAAAYAARQLCTLGAEVLLVEPPEGASLRREPPFLGENGDVSALFAVLAAGKTSITLNITTKVGCSALYRELMQADILIESLPRVEKMRCKLTNGDVAARCPDLIHVSVLPFGERGSKAGWRAEEINVMHASGEGYLLPNGLSAELFPDAPPLKIHGHFSSMQGGAVAALSALTALWAKPIHGGQFVDVSVQDAAVAVGSFAIQRLGDGSLEHRAQRSFKYGGIVACADGFIELLTLEDRQWTGLVRLLGDPEWALQPHMLDAVSRGRNGAEINEHIRAWAATRNADDIVAEAQGFGIPIAKYRSPEDILSGDHEAHRGLFTPVDIPGCGVLDMIISPYLFDGQPLAIRGPVPERLPDDPATPVPVQSKTVAGSL
jgi:crotonobetainyl-CoA:carnitine CoA-transferase CaiB-like acyl-CoA transferase